MLQQAIFDQNKKQNYTASSLTTYSSQEGIIYILILFDLKEAGPSILIAPLVAICYLHPFSKSLLMVAINGSVWLQAA